MIRRRIGTFSFHPSPGLNTQIPGLKWRPRLPRLSDLTWGPFATMDASQKVLTFAVGASILIHAVILSIHFKLPDALRKLTTPQTLEVVLVNSKSRNRPLKPDVLAQSNVDGGGNTDANRRAKSTSPVTLSEKSGDDLRQASQRVRELESEQRQMMTQTKPATPPVQQSTAQQTQPVPRPTPSGADLVSRSMQMLQLEAQIARNVDEYNKRPKMKFVGVRAEEFRFAQYVEDWRLKVERIGNLNYPEAARGKLYGDLQMEVQIKADGTIDKVQIRRSSGHAVLDRAAEAIVRMAAPYAPFPADIRRDTDILSITRTWHFTQGDRLFGD